MQDTSLHDPLQPITCDFQDRSSLPATDVRPRRILLVDDESTVRDCLAMILILEGYKVDAVPSCLDALLQFIRTPYRCMIVDLLLPEGSGLLLYHQVTRVDPELARRIIFVTGLEESHDLVQQARETSLPIFRKPIPIRHLLEVVDG